ncbi:hypothetical protein B4135_1103 [Caldibacillus debilis]|uniref:Uncharacterized protein n=1 Tax=Caldibacillus debilis TaxID=301148 RepID=A0A150MDJ0_9BACI|nr:hypothetical protein B4135_1103 [Caldibacillus debilis]
MRKNRLPPFFPNAIRMKKEEPMQNPPRSSREETSGCGRKHHLFFVGPERKKDCEMFRKIIIYSLVKIFLRSAIR